MERIQIKNPTEPWSSGQIFGRYKLIKELGAGGMASVFLAEQRGEQGFSRKVALKIVHPHLALQDDFEDYFVSEARLGGVLHHPNLLATLDFGQVEGRWYMSMEYVDGWTLSELVSALPQPHASHHHPIYLQVLIQVCRGLAYAHMAQDAEGRALRIVHRDIKPSNILIDRHGGVKLADFGVARAESNVHRTAITGVIKGSLRYLSPEQALGDRDIDGRADLYSLGLVLYFLLMGRSAYQSDNDMHVLRMAMDGAVGPALEQLPAWPYRGAVLKVLKGLLALEREDRYKNAEVVEQALLELQQHVGMTPMLSARWIQTHMVKEGPEPTQHQTNEGETLAEPEFFDLPDITYSRVSRGALSVRTPIKWEEDPSSVGYVRPARQESLLPASKKAASPEGTPESLWGHSGPPLSTELLPTVEVSREKIPQRVREQLGQSRASAMASSPEVTLADPIRPRTSPPLSSPELRVKSTAEAHSASRPSKHDGVEMVSLFNQPSSPQAKVSPASDIQTRPRAQEAGKGLLLRRSHWEKQHKRF